MNPDRENGISAKRGGGSNRDSVRTYREMGIIKCTLDDYSDNPQNRVFVHSTPQLKENSG